MTQLRPIVQLQHERELKIKDLYNFRSRSYWLRRLENYDRKERVPVDEYTIEHILPQSDNKPEKVPAEWRQSLGDDWENIWESYRHTLGNLTLTGYNSEYSNRTFTEKRDMEGGFSQSPLRLNDMLRKQSDWNKEALELRAGILAEKAAQVWESPSLDVEVLDSYKPAATAMRASYTIEDHKHLAPGTMRDLFVAFRKQVLALDPVVSEEFLKLYVAYKAETNFVDVIPKAKELNLSLNMAFADIDDPNDMCVDVTGKGRWGNGDIQVNISSVEELPYVMGLVRQSFEQQMGDGATD